MNTINFMGVVDFGCNPPYSPCFLLISMYPVAIVMDADDVMQLLIHK